MSVFPELHSKQEVIKLDNSVFPPFDTGFTWSITNLAPSCGVRPQYWHIKLSLSKIWKRILMFAQGLSRTSFVLTRAIFLPQLIASLEPFSVPFLGTLRPSNLRALLQEPKRLIYTLGEGKPFNFFSSWYATCLPSNLLALLNSDNKKDSVRPLRIVPLGTPLFLFIATVYHGINKKTTNKAVPFYLPETNNTRRLHNGKVLPE
jgi:hypothetical protein